MAGYNLTCVHPWPNEVAAGWLSCCPGIVWEPIQKRAHTQIVSEHSATVVSARWDSVDWSWHKKRNYCAWANLQLKKKKKKSAGGEWMNDRTFFQIPRKRGYQRAHLLVVGTLRFMSIYKPTELAPSFFCSVLVSVSVFIALSTVFHPINSPDNSPLSLSVLLVLYLPYWSFQLHNLFMLSLNAESFWWWVCSK